MSAQTPSDATADSDGDLVGALDAELSVVGAGAVGVILARDAASCAFSSVVLELGAIGGVWCKNDYPGLRLQGSSATYRCFSLSPEWQVFRETLSPLSPHPAPLCLAGLVCSLGGCCVRIGARCLRIAHRRVLSAPLKRGVL